VSETDTERTADRPGGAYEVGAWGRTPEEEQITTQAFSAAAELGWGEASREEYFAFISGFRVGYKEALPRSPLTFTPDP
jgi:hypothetical protein